MPWATGLPSQDWWGEAPDLPQKVREPIGGFQTCARRLAEALPSRGPACANPIRRVGT